MKAAVLYYLDPSYLPSDNYLNINGPLEALPIIFKVQFKYYITYLKIDIDAKLAKRSRFCSLNVFVTYSLMILLAVGRDSIR